LKLGGGKYRLSHVNKDGWSAWRLHFEGDKKAKVRWAQEYKKTASYLQIKDLIVTSREESIGGGKPPKGLNTLELEEDIEHLA
jgi:hypothetical protein